MENYILIIEDDVLVAENAEFILNEAGYHTIKIVDNFDEAVEFARNNKIELIISVITLCGLNNGPKIIKELQKSIHPQIIYLTTYLEEQIVNEALLTNPAAFVLKPFTDLQLLVSVKIAFKNIKKQIEKNKPTRRELQVVEQIVKGFNNKQIAELLFLSEHTVKAHRRNLIKKYQVKSSSELIVIAIKYNWISIDKLIN
jgi:DNA-binding NarL/FixJ family response regulator